MTQGLSCTCRMTSGKSVSPCQPHCPRLQNESLAMTSTERHRTHQCTAGRHLLDPQHDLLAERGWPEDLGHQSSAAGLLGSELPPTEEHLVGLKKQRQGKAESPERPMSRRHLGFM